MDDFIIALREQTGTPINFMEKEHKWLMNLSRDLVSCIKKTSRIDTNYKKEAMPMKLSPKEVFQYSLPWADKFIKLFFFNFTMCLCIYMNIHTFKLSQRQRKNRSLIRNQASQRKKRRILSRKDLMFEHRRVFNCNYPVQDIMYILSNKQNHKYQNRTFCSAQWRYLSQR